LRRPLRWGGGATVYTTMFKRHLMLGLLLSAALACAFIAGHVFAGASASTLTYGGTLVDGKGSALTGAHKVEVRFLSSSMAGSGPLCRLDTNTDPQLPGRFSASVADDCVAKVSSATDIWTEVLVDGASLGTTQIGAVPFSLHANRATVADTLVGQPMGGFAAADHKHTLQNCMAISGPCANGTYNQPTFFLDRVNFACPAGFMMTSFSFARCGVRTTDNEGLQINASCCELQ
jgi:hypothetical protein